MFACGQHSSELDEKLFVTEAKSPEPDNLSCATLLTHLDSGTAVSSFPLHFIFLITSNYSACNYTALPVTALFAVKIVPLL